MCPWHDTQVQNKVDVLFCTKFYKYIGENATSPACLGKGQPDCTLTRKLFCHVTQLIARTAS